jgi:hypothetical protein
VEKYRCEAYNKIAALGRATFFSGGRAALKQMPRRRNMFAKLPKTPAKEAFQATEETAK